MALILIVIAICLSVTVVIYPVKIGKLSINIASGPIIFLIVLFILNVIDLETIKLGIIGNSHIRPWEIIMIFFTAAYVSISVDVTGILDFFAYKIIRRADGNGVKLFLLFYLFSCVLTVFTSNDIVILILTPIIFYIGKHAKVNVIPLLFAEFFGANTASMLLYIGNPTNIIVGNALGLGFLEYTQIMWFPTVAATAANFILLYLFFNKTLTRKFKPNNDSKFMVRNWPDAVISCILLIIMLGALTASQFLKIPIWVITSAFAIVFIIEDLLFGLYYAIKHKSLPATELIRDEEEVFMLYGIPEHRNDFWIAVKRIPWKILPFTVFFFILVAGLGRYGVMSWLSDIISKISPTLASSIAAHGILGFILANIINNQPMTILLSSMLNIESFQMPPAAFMGGAYAVIIASNLGANLTLIGALAGLMWKKILQNKNLEISYASFLKTGIMITPIVFVFSLLALYFAIKLNFAQGICQN
jgi:arsenical pump membrane protein